MDNPEEFRCISLCSGYAGLELGIRRAVPALRTVCYVEIEAFACANLVSKIEKGELDAAPIWTDIKTFDGWPFYKRVHLITAGYPCQPFSVAGKRKGTDDPRHLWPHIERIISAVQPIWFFGENVSGHLSIGFPEVYRSLRLMGYKVEAGLFTARECGAPHKRQRLFILAHSTKRWRRGYKDARDIWQNESPKVKVERPSELANSCRAASGNQDRQTDRGTRQEDVPQGNGQVGSVRAGAASELADTTRQRIQRSITEGTAQARRQIDQQSDKWPSRPGQPQYEWEEPRVVADNRSRRHINSSGTTPEQNSNKQKNRILEQNGQYKNGQTKSRLGRAANGTSSRVDRLRLLGNGVVPQQAEKAFRELIKLF